MMIHDNEGPIINQLLTLSAAFIMTVAFADNVGQDQTAYNTHSYI